ncbi:hypothetical protein BUALT_Bualt02G0013000 [Buddleja alternifolia]|uniref:DUF7755 domain-containing protein n=1 Tax=Buddleja alternifolia TaxID=168488 RepID=A0AAV6Y2Z8_9LAMI|nr:hypothetical protein BUALT_Bualt02G0013000 [Buddleja alternifolia]
MLLQVTKFSCGGFVLGAAIHHAICDGIGATIFFNAVAELARGSGQMAVDPVWDRTSLLGPRNPTRVEVPIHEVLSLDKDFIVSLIYIRRLPHDMTKACGIAGDEKVTFAYSINIRKLELGIQNSYHNSIDYRVSCVLKLINFIGTSFNQKMVTSWSGKSECLLPATRVGTDTLQLQRGSVHEFAFEGPKLGTIVAVWISVESGQWRIGGLSLNVISHCQQSSAENDQVSKQLTSLQYNFEVEDILLGEKSEFSMMEFRPYSVTSFSEDEFTLFNKKSLNSSIGNDLISNEESMKEYADLKFSLLFYDTILILAGSSILSFSAGENAIYAFLTGGMCGFCYLLLLQRSVDGLPAQELIPSGRQGSFGQIFGRFKGPILTLVLAFAFAIATVKYGLGEDAVKLTPKDLVFGMMGFLMCKVSVVLAAFKPMPISFRDNKQSL